MVYEATPSPPVVKVVEKLPVTPLMDAAWVTLFSVIEIDPLGISEPYLTVPLTIVEEVPNTMLGETRSLKLGVTLVTVSDWLVSGPMLLKFASPG